MSAKAICLIGVLLSLTPTAALGQEGPWRVQGSVGLTAASFAAEADVAQSSVGIRLGVAPRLYGVLAAHLEGGVEYLGRLCFEAGAACAAERGRAPSSDTFMLSGTVALGMLTPPVYLGVGAEGIELAVGLFAGREWVEAGLGRGDCLNCRVAGLDLRGGLFVEPTLELWFMPGVALHAGYRVYSRAADLHRRLTLRLIIGPES